MSGTGKTTNLLQLNNELHPDEHITICPTHKACNLVDGCTIHRMFCINPIDLSYEYKQAQELKPAGIKHIFIDEVSMVSEILWCILCHSEKYFNFIFIGFGDFMQLKPVNEEHIYFQNSWLVKHLFNNSSCKLTKVHRLTNISCYKMPMIVHMVKISILKGMAIKNVIYPYAGLIFV